MAEPMLAPTEMSAQPAPAMSAAPIPDGSTGPATTMPKSAGMEAQAPMWVDAALNFLRRASTYLDPESEKGRALHKAMESLGGSFGAPSPDLTRASLKMAEETMPAVGPTSPAAFADMMRQVGAKNTGQMAPAPVPPAMAGV